MYYPKLFLFLSLFLSKVRRLKLGLTALPHARFNIFSSNADCSHYRVKAKNLEGHKLLAQRR